MQEQELNPNDPYDMGFQHACDDKLPDCPYVENSQEARQWWEGYDQGCRVS